jgi:hypothetical protein
MGKYRESISCCNQILEDYPENGDVLYDKSCNFVMLSENDTALSLLEHAISQGVQYKVKAKKSETFKQFSNNARKN